MRTAVIVGRWYAWHFRRNLLRSTTFAVARQMRKQGVPIVIARLIILGKP